jgi:hypothetical protein
MSAKSRYAMTATARMASAAFSMLYTRSNAMIAATKTANSAAATIT